MSKKESNECMPILEKVMSTDNVNWRMYETQGSLGETIPIAGSSQETFEFSDVDIITEVFLCCDFKLHVNFGNASHELGLNNTSGYTGGSAFVSKDYLLSILKGVEVEVGGQTMQTIKPSQVYSVNLYENYASTVVQASGASSKNRVHYEIFSGETARFSFKVRLPCCGSIPYNSSDYKKAYLNTMQSKTTITVNYNIPPLDNTIGNIASKGFTNPLICLRDNITEYGTRIVYRGGKVSEKYRDMIDKTILIRPEYISRAVLKTLVPGQSGDEHKVRIDLTSLDRMLIKRLLITVFKPIYKTSGEFITTGGTVPTSSFLTLDGGKEGDMDANQCGIVTGAIVAAKLMEGTRTYTYKASDMLYSYNGGYPENKATVYVIELSQKGCENGIVTEDAKKFSLELTLKHNIVLDSTVGQSAYVSVTALGTVQTMLVNKTKSQVHSLK